MWDSYTEEELKQFEDQIPEWKKGAMTFSKDQYVEQKSVLDKVFGKMNTYLKKLAEDDEEYEKMLDEFKELKSSYKASKSNIQQTVKSSESTIIQKGIDIVDKTKTKMGSKAMEIIKKNDPDFDLLEFEEEALFIFEKIYSKFLEQDLEYLEGVCVNDAFGYFKSIIVQQQELGVHQKYKSPLFIKSFTLNNGVVHPETSLPMFDFLVEFSEIHCLVKNDEPDVIVEGYESNMLYTKFTFVLAPYDLADVGTLQYS